HLRVQDTADPLEIPVLRIAKVERGAPPEAPPVPPDAVWVKLACGDTLHGRPSDPAWVLDLGFARRAVRLSETQRIEMAGEGAARVTFTSGTTLKGRLVAPAALRIELVDDGARLEIE